MTSLRPLKKRLSRLEGAAAAIASGDLAARVNTAEQGDLVDSLGRTFNEMAGRIQALISSHQELLGMVAHEIRTPLARMRFALELLKDSANTTDDSRLARMEEDLSSMDMLLTELLAFNRLSRSDRITVAPLDLEVVASEVAAAEGWSRPEIELGIEGSAVCRADAGLVARALSNLVRNAVKHASGRVRISLSMEGGHACASVADDGPGFDPMLAGKLGRPFVKDPASTGSGLGLAIVERVAALHGGWVEYARASEGGACVRLCLPLEADGTDRS
jgi:two-component system sensor histidine kinase RstB